MLKYHLLFDLVDALNVGYILERSFKVSEKTLLGNRFLLSVPKMEIKQNPHEKILDICQRMDMPESYLETFSERLSDVEFMYFGFEENEKSCVYKVYLDFSADLDREAETDPRRLLALLDQSHPFLMFFGFKWDVLDNTKRTLTSYTLYPSLSFDSILEGLSSIFRDGNYREPLEIAKGFLAVVSRRATHDKINYLDVTEGDSKRRSFDLNVYNAELQLKEIYPLLERFYQHYSVPADSFHALYDQIAPRALGHLSGGIGREGRDFLSIYYGAGFRQAQ